MTNKKKSWGGERKNAGRPKKQNARKYFSAMISQETDKKIREIKEKTGKSFGQIVDDALK